MERKEFFLFVLTREKTQTKREKKRLAKLKGFKRTKEEVWWQEQLCVWFLHCGIFPQLNSVGRVLIFCVIVQRQRKERK